MPVPLARTPISRTLVVLGLAALALGLGPVARAADLPSLYVDYREDCTFRVTNDAGATVTQVAPTTYQVVSRRPPRSPAVFTPGANDLIGCRGTSASG